MSPNIDYIQIQLASPKEIERWSQRVLPDNEIVGEINKTVHASCQFELKYDDDFSSQIQLKQVLSAGISLNFY